MCAAVEQAGLRIVEHINFSAEVVKRGEPPHQANDVVMGDDFEQRRANVMTGLQEQRLVGAASALTVIGNARGVSGSISQRGWFSSSICRGRVGGTSCTSPRCPARSIFCPRRRARNPSACNRG
jgi:hypothetical protein